MFALSSLERVIEEEGSGQMYITMGSALTNVLCLQSGRELVITSGINKETARLSKARRSRPEHAGGRGLLAYKKYSGS